MIRVVLLIAALVSLVGIAQADSLWSAQSTSLFVDVRARKVGDILTVLVVEATNATHQATHQTSKKVETDTPGGSGPVLSWMPALSLSASRSSDGSGSTSTVTRVTDRITVSVTGVDPQGNLTVSGSREIQMGADKLEMQFSGKVRSADISAENTVLSSNVADMQVTWSAKGPIAEKQKPGLIYRLLHLLW